MRYRMPFIMGVAVGYILGSKAGRERYEQIKRTAQRVGDNPRVQETAGVLGAQMSKVSEVTRAKMSGPLADKLPFRHRGDHDAEAGTGWPGEKADQTKPADQTGIPY